MAAEAAFAKGEYAKAWKHVGIAARWVKWGYDSLNWWLDRLEVGGARAVATFKVSAALATLVASAPVELGILGTMAVGAVSEGSQQGMGLLTTAIDPKASVSLEDIKKAAMATAINVGSAGAGKILGKLIAKGLIGMVAKRYLSEGASEAAVKFFETRIEQYVGANAQAIANKMLKLDTEPDWNWWYMLIAPCLNGVAIEMAKEPELQKMLKK